MAQRVQQAECDDMLRELVDHDPDEDGKRMTPWELNFVEDLEKQRDREQQFARNDGRAPRSLWTPKRAAKLAEVWERIFG